MRHMSRRCTECEILIKTHQIKYCRYKLHKMFPQKKVHLNQFKNSSEICWASWKGTKNFPQTCDENLCLYIFHWQKTQTTKLLLKIKKLSNLILQLSYTLIEWVSVDDFSFYN